MITRLNELHSLIIYIVFGYALLLPLVLFSLRVFDISEPLQRLRIYLVAFLTPVAAFVLYHTVLLKRCESGLTPPWFESTFHFLCLVAGEMLKVFVPLLVLLAGFAAIKAVAAVLIVKRYESKAVYLDSETFRVIDTIVATKSQELGMFPPRVIYSQRDHFAAFTTGFIKPVIVINYKMVGLLNESEMEAVISHELIHIKQRDTMKNWLLHLVRDISLLNPLSAQLLKGYLLEKEMICDQQAAELANQKPQVYAETLLKVWRSLIETQGPRLITVSSFTGSGGMERRIGSLLKGKQRKGKYSELVTVFCGIFIFSATLLFLGLVC